MKVPTRKKDRRKEDMRVLDGKNREKIQKSENGREGKTTWGD